MISWKELKDKAKAIDQYRAIKKKMKDADGDSMKLMILEMSDDMQTMLHNFDNMLDILKDTQLKCFKLAGEDSLRIGGEKIYKDKELEQYEKIREWCDGVKIRWAKGVDEYERISKVHEV
jgi:hypothetical protein